jgi:phage pi2 protein 07
LFKSVGLGSLSRKEKKLINNSARNVFSWDHVPSPAIKKKLDEETAGFIFYPFSP